MFTQKELKLQQIRWLELLKDYNMSFLYHPRKANVVADVLCHMIMGSVSHIDEAKIVLVKAVHRLARLGLSSEDSSNYYLMFHNNIESSIAVEVKSKQHLDKSLM